MAAGRPVILAIDGVIRQVVEEAQGGLFTPPGDVQALVQTILRLADDPQQGRQLGLNARSYVEAHFDRAVLAHHLAEICEQMGEKRAGAKPR
jgi:glycosyltransferase involved in cell wall biosynthesis